MSKDLEILEKNASVYFDSINDLFLYRLRNYWKYSLFLILLSFSIIFLFFNIIPFIPSMGENYLSPIISFISEKIIHIAKVNFWIRWLVGTVFSLSIFIFFLPFYMIWDNKIEKKAVPLGVVNFCYLFASRKELRNFITNERSEHLKKARKYTVDVILSLNKLKIEDKDNLPIDKVLDSIKRRFHWFGVDEFSQKYIEALSSIQNKVIERLKQKVLIEDLLDVIDWLTLYEYSKIKPNEINSEKTKIGENSTKYYEEFIDSINKLSPMGLPIKESTRSKFNVKRLISWLGSLLYNDSIILMFFSWLLLLSFVFLVGAIIIIQSFSIIIDTTFLIGMMSAPFIGAITFAATIYSKTRK